MKIAFLVLCLSALSAALLAKDLKSAARRERARREALASAGRVSRSFGDADLSRYRREPGSAPPGAAERARSAPLEPSSRDLARERAHWRAEAERHRRELERLDAGIRRLEWRLAERRGRRRPGERLARDASDRLLEESLESAKEERRRCDERFRERARKAGALPGWLR